VCAEEVLQIALGEPAIADVLVPRIALVYVSGFAAAGLLASFTATPGPATLGVVTAWLLGGRLDRILPALPPRGSAPAWSCPSDAPPAVRQRGTAGGAPESVKRGAVSESCHPRHHEMSERHSEFSRDPTGRQSARLEWKGPT
jgi:hypothetical protein